MLMSKAIANNKDTAFKIFGHTIQLPGSSAGEYEQQHKDPCDDCKDGNEPLTAKELEDQNPIPDSSEIIKESPAYNDSSTAKTSKNEEGQGETSNSEEKILKKPDTILPCPRCNSMETKFCYFNNYNVSQPRHFCKNCQRYWTAGGTMRNVPVGAGRRRNKNSVFHYRHRSMSETVLNARTDLLNGNQQPSLKLDGTILTFDKPLCESLSSFSNVADKTTQNCSGNGFHKYEDVRIPVACEAKDNGDDHSEGSSVTAVSSKDSVNKGGFADMLRQNCNNFSPNFPCFTGAPWPHPWSSMRWSNAVPPPGYCLPGFPMQFYPATAYWGCTMPGSWNVPWMSPPAASQDQMPPTWGPYSPNLGKHPRDESELESTGSVEEPLKVSNPDKCLWFPKTLRVDDPGDAAKSSMATLGLKHDTVDSASRGHLKAFLPKNCERNHVSETSTVLQANPAAMSRSLNFNETT